MYGSKKGTNVKTSILAAAVALGAWGLSADTVNDLAPYDNTIDSGVFWNTTGHELTTVNRSSKTLAVALDAAPSVDKDETVGPCASGFKTWFDAVFDIFRCNPPTGLLLFLN